jgi:hypothetical protein
MMPGAGSGEFRGGWNERDRKRLGKGKSGRGGERREWEIKRAG